MAKSTAPMVGDVFRTLKSEIVHAHQAGDREMIVDIMNRYHAFKENTSNLRKLIDSLYDTAHLGFTDVEYLKGIDRIVKIDPDNPRGRKAVVKADPADLC
jgi:hypothetical protein